MSTIPITAKGAERIKAEIKRLKTIERPRIIKAIATAREHGDLKENAEYHAAKEQQSFNEGRLQELEAALSNGQFIDVSGITVTDKIVFGATVELFDVANEETVTYQIVGEVEADIKSGLISITSPIARALIGKHLGDEAEFNAPGGVKVFEVLDIKYE